MTSDSDGRGQGSGGILRRAWLPALCGLLLGGFMFTVISARKVSYETCAYLRINSGPVDQAVLGLPASDKPITNLIGETAEEIEQKSTAGAAVRLLDGRPYSNPADLLDAIAAKPDLNSGLIGVCAKAETARQAQRVANGTARAYVLLNRKEQKANIRAARRELLRLQAARVVLLKREGGSNVAIKDAVEKGKDQIERLTLAERINTDSVVVIKPADLPGGPAGIPAAAVGFVGFLLGAGIVFGLTAVREQTDRRIRSRAELERIAGLPILAAVRRRRTLKRRRPLERLRRREAEPFRLLYARLCNATDAKDRKAIAIVAVGDSGTGSSVTWYLSATAAGAGARVLLLEADPDRPSSVDGPGGRPAGVTDVLAGTSSLEDVVFHVAADDRHAVDVLSPGERHGGPRLPDGLVLEHLLAQTRAGYDHVFIDTAPVTDADAVPFVRQAEAAVVVFRRGGSDRDALREALTQIAVTGTPVLGLVAVDFAR